MQTRILLAVIAGAAGAALTACHSASSPSAPKTVDTFVFGTVTMSDTAGTATMIEATVNLDQTTVADSCPPSDFQPIYDVNGFLLYYVCTAPAAASYTFAGGGGINPGSHTLTFFVSSQNSNNAVTYTVSAFTLVINDQNGKLLKNLSFPSQTASLPPGQAISYSFSY